MFTLNKLNKDNIFASKFFLTKKVTVKLIHQQKVSEEIDNISKIHLILVSIWHIH